MESKPVLMIGLPKGSLEDSTIKLFGKAGFNVIKRSRSQRDDAGMFTSQFLFELAAGTTEEQCVQRLQEISQGVVDNLKVNKEATRSKLTGSTSDYTVTHVCGATPEGAMRSLVSFRWTRAPGG